jgi:hypothetical protein
MSARAEPNDVNFATRMPLWGEVNASAKKSPMSAPVHSILASYAVGGSSAGLRGTTFLHIDNFLASGEAGAQPARLRVACADFGYTLDELRALRAAGKLGRDVAAEVVSRGVAVDVEEY